MNNPTAVYHASAVFAIDSRGKIVTMGKLHIRPDCPYLSRSRPKQARDFHIVTVSGTITEHLEKCLPCQLSR